MGSTKLVACPSGNFFSVVPTKTYYKIVPVFVKGRCPLLALFPLGMLVLVLLGGICSSFGHAPRVKCRVPGQEEGCRTSILHINGGPFASPAVGCPPHVRQARLPESLEEQLPLGLPDASNFSACRRLSTDLERYV
jgi:hypothetical protein